MLRFLARLLRRRRFLRSRRRFWVQTEGERLLRRFLSETQRDPGCVRWNRLTLRADCGLTRSHGPAAFENAAAQFDLVDERREGDSNRLKINPADTGTWRR